MSKDKTKSKIQWQAYEFDDIIEYWAKDFQPKNGMKVSSYDYFSDPYKHKIIFRLYLVEEST